MEAKQLQWPGEPPKPQQAATLWLNTGATRDAIHGKPKAFWAFDPEGRLVPLPCTTGVAAPQLEIEFARNGDTITGIRAVRIKGRYHDRGWREADALFQAEGRADKIRAFESFKEQYARGINQALPDAYLPEKVIQRRVQVKAETNRLELPPLDDALVEAAENEQPKAPASKRRKATEGEASDA